MLNIILAWNVVKGAPMSDMLTINSTFSDDSRNTTSNESTDKLCFLCKSHKETFFSMAN